SPPRMKATEETDKHRVALSSVVASVFLTLFKLIIGLLTGSLGILAEAAHSGLDMVAAMITYLAVRAASRPPDAGHLYGHGKIENFSALVETLLLLATCGWIIYEAVRRLSYEMVTVEANVWAFLIMLISIAVDVSRSRALYRAAKRFDSQALEADALHFSTDIWSSAVVILGLILVRVGQAIGQERLFSHADAIAALIVAVIVIWVSVRLGRRTVEALLDQAPAGLSDRIAAIASAVPGVASSRQVRVRRSGPTLFVDLTIVPKRAASLEQAHELASAVERRLQTEIPRLDVIVHVEPPELNERDIVQRVRAIAARLQLDVHEIHVHDVRGQRHIGLHLEVPSRLTLDEAHRIADRLEEAVRQEIPNVAEVETHIEPVAQEEQARNAIAFLLPLVQKEIASAAEALPNLHGWHDVHLRKVGNHYFLSLHCVLAPETTVEASHQICSHLEHQLRQRIPVLEQVLIHTEPS
ncbi:MAG TPA: cation-efflux pump, partial [Anaerolineae bacterium]|nr:cation-efflux pump [Anaerolineae bacterium]